MRSSIAVIALVAGVAFAVPARAAVDVRLAFTPSTAPAFSTVTLSVSIMNTSATPVSAAVGVSVSARGFTLGPARGHVSLAARQTRSREMSFTVPPLGNGTALTIKVTGAAGGVTDTATATLTIGSSSLRDATDASLRNLPSEVLAALGAAPTGVAATTFAGVKALYR